MNEPLVSEDTDLDRLLSQIKTEHGDAADILYQDSVRRGGVMGFFAQEVHRVVYRVSECSDISPHPAAQIHPFQSLLNERMSAKQADTQPSPKPAQPAVAKGPVAQAAVAKTQSVKTEPVKASSATLLTPLAQQDNDDAWLEDLLSPIEAHDFEHTEASKVSSYQFPRAEPVARGKKKKQKTPTPQAKTLSEPEPETEMAVLEALPVPMTAQERFAELIKTMHELEPEVSANEPESRITDAEITPVETAPAEITASDAPAAHTSASDTPASDTPAFDAIASDAVEILIPQLAISELVEAGITAPEPIAEDIETVEIAETVKVETETVEIAETVKVETVETVEIAEIEPVQTPPESETQVLPPAAEDLYRGSHSTEAVAEHTVEATTSTPVVTSTRAGAHVDENAEVVDLPATGSSDARARMDLMVRLHEVGIPAGLQLSTEATNVYEALDEILLQLADVPVAPRAAGDVLLIIGDLGPATRAAQSAARSLRLPESDIRIADARPTEGPEHRISNPRQAQRERAELADADVATVIVLATDGSEAGHSDPWVGDMIEALAPTAVWACVDATRKSGDTIAKLTLLGEIDALVVHSAAISSSPASVWDIGVPVALLDDRPATVAAWAGLLLGLLAETARHSGTGQTAGRSIHADAIEADADLPRARHRSA